MLGSILEDTGTTDEKGQPIYIEHNDMVIASILFKDKYIKDEYGGKVLETITANVRGNIEKGFIVKTKEGKYRVTMISQSMFANKNITGEKL